VLHCGAAQGARYGRDIGLLTLQDGVLTEGPTGNSYCNERAESDGKVDPAFGNVP
jgi:hypothetical protein